MADDKQEAQVQEEVKEEIKQEQEMEAEAGAEEQEDDQPQGAPASQAEPVKLGYKTFNNSKEVLNYFKSLLASSEKGVNMNEVGAAACCRHRSQVVGCQHRSHAVMACSPGSCTAQRLCVTET